MNLRFAIETKTSAAARDFALDRLVIAGWAGRDRAAIEHHIEELAALGVPRPSAVPLFYRASENIATQNAEIQVVGNHTSGEAEVFVFQLEGAMYISIASDHTDRKLEATGVALSKQICPKPIALTAWPFEEVASHWDQLILRSHIEEGGGEILYQEGPLASLRPPCELIALFTGASEILPAGVGMLCGTVGAIGGIRPAKYFAFELYDPLCRRSLRHAYRVETLPEVT